jgi:hypothetical protein
MIKKKKTHTHTGEPRQRLAVGVQPDERARDVESGGRHGPVLDGHPTGPTPDKRNKPTNMPHFILIFISHSCKLSYFFKLTSLFLEIAQLQGALSYTFMDPALTDRAFLASKEVMIAGFAFGALLAIAYIAVFGFIGERKRG